MFFLQFNRIQRIRAKETLTHRGEFGVSSNNSLPSDTAASPLADTPLAGHYYPVYPGLPRANDFDALAV